MSIRSRGAIWNNYVKERGLYSLLILLKSLHSLGVVYLCLNIPKYNNKYGKRFTYSAPVLWNKLPGNVKYADSVMSFKGLLKTHLFRSAYVGFS